jgi:uncharacterized alkaline shock family protein YloU
MSLELTGDGGTLVVSSSVVAHIVATAAESVEGVHVHKPRRRIEVAVEGESAQVALTLSLAYGRAIPEAAHEVQERVADAVRTMLGVEPRAVDVSVVDLVE